MTSEIAVLGMGAMGSAIAARLAENGAAVITNIDGRSSATRQRVAAIKIETVSWERIASAAVILSIVPPDQVMDVAETLRTYLDGTGKTPTFVDLNAINPSTVKDLVAVLEPSGSLLVDGCIIGGPPSSDRHGPRIYVSGPQANAVTWLGDFGLSIATMDGEIGDASALKMLYAGLNKGITGLAAIMLLTAAQRGFSDVLTREMRASMPSLVERFERSIPDMFPKAGRWVPEMNEIAEFLGKDSPGNPIFQGLAEVFEQFADRNPAAFESRQSLQKLLQTK